MKSMISPSIMCADLMELRPHLRELEALGVDYLHVDVMDGVLCPIMRWAQTSSISCMPKPPSRWMFT